MKIIKLIGMIVIIVSSIYSQEEMANPKYAISFGIKDNFRLDKFNMDIALKKIIDDTHQLRVFLSPRLSSRKYDVTSSQKIENLYYSIGVGSDYLWLISIEDEMNMFVGTGAIVTYGSNNNKSTTAILSGSQIDEDINPSTSIGIRGSLGVEWKVTERIGLHSEYLFTGLYYWDKSTQKSSVNGVAIPNSINTSTVISLSSQVLFGVSIYL